MDFRILGPLEVRDERGSVALGGPKRRAVLAVLLLRANRPVRVDVLVQALWGDDAPPTGVKAMQVHISRLRNALRDPAILATTPAGYRLRVQPGELDRDRFETLAEEGRRQLTEGKPTKAAASLRKALEMWQGEALADLAFDPSISAEVALLEDQRLAALEARVEADLAAGRDAALVGELQRLVAAYPTRELFTGQLMIALYRCERQSAALEAYRKTRSRLIEEIGVEPGPSLNSLHEAILRHELAPFDGRAPPGVAAEGSVTTGRTDVEHRPDLERAIPEADEDTQAPPRSHAAEGQRRQLAVLVFDLVDSTPLAHRMDIDDFSELMLAVQRLATAELEALGGTVGVYSGDGLLAWFGWPVAHEDDTALAVRAGLNILARLDELNATMTPRQATPLAARVGVHVGPVILRTDRSDTPAFGETLHVAARLGAFAEPGTVAMSSAAHSIAGAEFHTEYLGEPALKGVDEPLGVFRADRSRGSNEGPVLEAAFAAPLVGRDRELDQLLVAWNGAKQGIGRTVVMSGEPGVGKSRLLATLREQVESDELRWLELRCTQLAVNTAFRPIADMVRRTTGIPVDSDPDEQRRRLRDVMPEALGEAGHLIAALLGLPTPDLPPPEKFRHDLMGALHAWLLALARETPIVLAGEDLQWSDPSTLEVLRVLQDRLVTAPVLIVLTKRPDCDLGFTPRSEMVLDRLDASDARSLARRLAARRSIKPEIADRVAERSDGVPLFIEELLAAVTQDANGNGLPSSLQSSLQARLDGLGGALEMAQIASVVGRSFTEQLIQRVADTSADSVADALRKLTAAGIISSHTSPDGLKYEFRHALIQDAAYESLLKRDRVALHLKVARLLEERFPEHVARDPELLGHHLANGGASQDAAGCFERAGSQAARAAALEEATAHYRRGIELLRDAEPSRECSRLEMWLQILLGNALMGLVGYGAESLRPVWIRAIELAEEVGDADELTAALNGLAVHEADNADLAAAIALAQRQLDIAEQVGSRVASVRGHGTMGLALFYRGHGGEALRHLEASIASYRDGDFQLVTFGLGHDQGIFARAMSAWVLWWLGRPDEALAEAQAGVTRAQELGSFLSLAMARHFLAMVHQLRRESEDALREAEVNATLAHELGFPFWEGAALVTAGAERAKTGEKRGLVDVQRGLELLSDAGSRSVTSSGLATLAEAHHATGDTRAAHGTVEAALGLSRERGEPYWDPELMRLKAEYLTAMDPNAGTRSDTLLREALAEANQSGAMGLALRVATSLGRRLAVEGRTSEAKAVAAAAIAAVTGGNETADMHDARALLREGAP